MSTATTMQAHIAYELIKDTNCEIIVVEFLSHDFLGPAGARELGEQLDSLIRPCSLQYFVIDFARVRSLGSTAFGEIVRFVRNEAPVWMCNLDATLRIGACLIGLNDCAISAASRDAAIREAVRTARRDDEDTIDFPDPEWVN